MIPQEDGPIRDAFWCGYFAGSRYHMGDGVLEKEPGHYTWEELSAYRDGFDEAGQDS